MADFHSAPPSANLTRISTPVAPRVEPPRPVVEPKLNDEEILSRAEQVQVEMQLPASLEALGAMTPIREVAMTLPPRR
jgi:hypothetical protein